MHMRVEGVHLYLLVKGRVCVMVEMIMKRIGFGAGKVTLRKREDVWGLILI